MSAILETEIEFVAATRRWSGRTDPMYWSGTVWYGMMCRSFLLLERMLRLCVVELYSVAGDSMRKAAERRAAAKPPDVMTMGQCLGVLEDVAPSLSAVLRSQYPELSVPIDVFPASDRVAWSRILSSRNRLAHNGPGFLDSVDMFSGRIWREYKIDVPLEQQSKEVWGLGRQLCKSPLIVTCITLQGVVPNAAQEQIEKAELVTLTLHELSSSGQQAIEDFHKPSSALGE